MQCKHATRKTETNIEDFHPLSDFLGHPAAKGIPNQKKKIVHGKDNATTTQSQPQCDKAGLSQDTGNDYASVDIT
jgi:hypothetical protein